MSSIRERFAAVTPKAVPVNVDGVGEVFIRPLTKSQADGMKADPDMEKNMLRAVLLAVCDEDGKPVWGDEDEIGHLPIPMILALGLAVGKLNGEPSRTDVEDAKKV